MKIKGKVHKFGNNINTDEIIASRYLNATDPKELGSHCMETLDKDFAKKVLSGDIIVAGKNFGCGSSREHAPLAIKGAGISCIIAESFARIFFRNSLNIGLPIFEIGKTTGIEAGDELEINVDEGRIISFSKGQEFQASPFPEFMKSIISTGGLMKWIRKQGVCL